MKTLVPYPLTDTGEVYYITVAFYKWVVLLQQRVDYIKILGAKGYD